MAEKELTQKERIELEGRSGGPVSNAMLDCANCKKAYDDNDDPRNTSMCEEYTVKPGSVLLGGKCKLKEAIDEA